MHEAGVEGPSLAGRVLVVVLTLVGPAGALLLAFLAADSWAGCAYVASLR